MAILQELRKKIEAFSPEPKVECVGTVTHIVERAVYLSGLSSVKINEVLLFTNETSGVVVENTPGKITVRLLGSVEGIKEGDTVKATGDILLSRAEQ